MLGKKTLDFITMNLISRNLFPLEIRGYKRLGKGFGFNIEPGATQNLDSEGNYGWEGLAFEQDS